MRFSKHGMVNLRPWKVPIKIVNAKDMYSEAIGTYKGKVLQQDGTTYKVILEDVLYIPDLYINLFSLTRILNNPKIDIHKVNGTIALTYNNKNHVIFDRDIQVVSGRLLWVEIVPHIDDQYESAQMTYDTYHQRLGHPNEQYFHQTAKYYNINLTGEAQVCENCAKAKIKKTKLSKESTEHVATYPGERISFDI